MSPATMHLWDRFRAMPRAVQWAVWAAAATAVTLLWTDVFMARTNDWNDRADGTLARIEEVRSGGLRLDRLESLEPYVRAIGAVNRPEGQAEAADALADAINDVLAAHTVTGDSALIRPPQKLPRETMTALLGPGERAYKLTAEVSFDATPEEAVAIIAELEARTEIESVSAVRLVKRGNNKVTADITVESWLVKKEKSLGGGV